MMMDARIPLIPGYVICVDEIVRLLTMDGSIRVMGEEPVIMHHTLARTELDHNRTSTLSNT